MKKSPRAEKTPLPPKFCNYGRLMDALDHGGLDGLVVHTRPHVFYLSGFGAPSSRSLGELSPGATIIISRAQPDHPILIVPEFELVYFVEQPTWIEDIRPFRGNLLPLDIPVEDNAVDRFIPEEFRSLSWIQSARQNYANQLRDACLGALDDLGLTSGTIGFDNLRFASQLDVPNIDVRDAFDVVKYARMVKTDEELALLQHAAQINQSAVERVVKQWEKGTYWQDVVHTYHQEVLDLGGFVADPSGLVIANHAGSDSSFRLSTGLDNPEITSGMSVMFDCHGTYNNYCWDGGKTWIVNDDPTSQSRLVADATEQAIGEMRSQIRDGMKISELQALIRGVFRKKGVPRADSLMVFFHGLGLDHQDQVTATNVAWSDWEVAEGMVLATHIYYPDDDRNRYWLEDISHLGGDGADPLFSWDASHL